MYRIVHVPRCGSCIGLLLFGWFGVGIMGWCSREEF